MSRARRTWLAKGGLYIVLGVITLVVLLPFLIMLVGPFRSPTDLILRGPLALPTDWSFHNLTRVFVEFSFGRYLLNTAIVSVPTTLVATVFAIMASFALAFIEFPLKGLVSILITVVGVLVSEEFIIIPLFHLTKVLGLINTFTAAILPQIALSACFSTLLIRSFFLGLPRELVDAASVDGASSWQTIWRVLVPISQSVIMTAATLTLTWTWNDYIIPLVMLQSPAKATLPLALTLFQGAHTIDIPLTMAGTVVTVLPMLIFYFLFQGHIVQGLTQGAVK